MLFFYSYIKASSKKEVAFFNVTLAVIIFYEKVEMALLRMKLSRTFVDECLLFSLGLLVNQRIFLME